MQARICIVVITCILHFSKCQGKKLESIEEKYKKGVHAYEQEKWSECIKNLESAIHLNKLFNSVVVDCRLECNNKEYHFEFDHDIEDLQMFDKFLKKAFCLLSCQKRYFLQLNMESILSEKVFKDMADRKPYDYIQLCYFKMNLLPKAANAAFTYLVTNPADKRVRKNYDFFIRQPEVDADDVIDLEGDAYGALHSQGEKAYDEEDWSKTVTSMEGALKDYLSYENKCRAKCEGPHNQGWHPDFVANVANHYLFVLQCKQECQNKLWVLGYKTGLSFIANILNHLQFAYYHLDQFNEAAKAVESFLRIYPVHEDMIENKKLYSSKADKDMFFVRPEVKHYIERQEYEQKLLDYIDIKYSNDSLDVDNMIK